MLRILCCLIAIGFPFFARTQGVGVNETGADPHPSAGLDVDFSNKGFVPPRMTSQQRDAILNPVTGLQIFNITTNCVNYWDGGAWFELCGNCTPPAPSAPSAAMEWSSQNQINWSWNSTEGALGYKWNTTDNYSSATDLGASLTYTQSVADSCTSFSCFVWAYNLCGHSGSLSLTALSGGSAPASPIAGAHQPGSNEIVWNWNPVAGASGYKWHTTNLYSASADIGLVNSFTQTGLTNCTPYTIYVWAYNGCGNSSPVMLTEGTGSCSVSATGGTLSSYVGNGTNGVNGVSYNVHTFTTSGTFSVSAGGSVDILVVAGGGGGASGGGGGGGVIYEENVIVMPQSYSITVGDGGSRGGPGVCCNVRGGNGQNSTFGSILTAVGGGGGGNWSPPNHDGLSGGSGGGSGAGCPGEVGIGGAPTVGQGYPGGYNNITSGCAPPYASAGGGGAGGSGQNASNSARTADGWQASGHGGVGRQVFISGSGNYYGGGGGGGTNNGGPVGTGGLGGGANGCNGEPCNAPNGSGNTGGGGGGSNGSGGGYGGYGGSGIVIIRYPQ